MAARAPPPSWENAPVVASTPSCVFVVECERPARSPCTCPAARRVFSAWRGEAGRCVLDCGQAMNQHTFTSCLSLRAGGAAFAYAVGPILIRRARAQQYAVVCAYIHPLSLLSLFRTRQGSSGPDQRPVPSMRPGLPAAPPTGARPGRKGRGAIASCMPPCDWLGRDAGQYKFHF